MHIGLLQAGHLPDAMQAEVGDYEQLYARLLDAEDIDPSIWPVVDGVFPPDVTAAEGWLISGSRHGAYDDLPWIPRLETFVRDVYAERVPLVGVCFGHQIIAQALGGRVEKFSGGWAVGRHDYDWNGDRVVLNAWHQDQVVEKPGGAEVVARSPFCEYAALVYPGGAFTLQAHPEFDRDTLSLLLKTRAPGLVPDELIKQAVNALDAPTDSQRMAGEIGAFFREAPHD